MPPRTLFWLISMGTTFLDSWPIADAEWSEKVMSPCGPNRQFSRRNRTSEVGGEADMPRQLDQRV
jgi:hypothetical protein